MKLSKINPSHPWSEISGYTLIEVLLYSLILSLFLLLTTQVFITVKLSSTQSNIFVYLSRNFRRASSDFTQTIRGAANVSSPLPGSLSASLVLNNGAITYQLDQGILKKTQSGQTWDLTTDEVTVSDLSFENAAESTQTALLRISMKIESNYLLEGGRKISEDFETTIGLR
ncbi:MAG TPA: hypothetical protein VMW41_01960 [Candidatus Bathyarchaeia archaeon]|nr:hypothetical protein [Candidatus Bathyarchaeia archaeon]